MGDGGDARAGPVGEKVNYKFGCCDIAYGERRSTVEHCLFVKMEK